MLKLQTIIVKHFAVRNMISSVVFLSILIGGKALFPYYIFALNLFTADFSSLPKLLKQDANICTVSNDYLHIDKHYIHQPGNLKNRP